MHHALLFQQHQRDSSGGRQDWSHDLRPFSVVHSVIFDSATRKATGVRVLDARDRKPLEFHAKVIFLCASTLESARLLFNSSTTEFPNGLANSSGELGHNLMDHVKTGGS